MYKALLLTTAMLLAVAAMPARADDFDGFVLGKVNLFGRSDTPLNPDNRFELPDASLETSVLVEGRLKSVRFRVRGEVRGTIASDRADSDWPRPARFRLQQLYVPLVSNNAVTVQLGKQSRSWDQGLSYTPLGFFRSNPDIRDPVDVEGRVEGLPMLVISHVGSRLAFEAIASDRLGGGDVAARRNGRQVALRVSGQPMRGLDAAFVARVRDGAPPGMGASLSYATGRLELHLDAYYGRPEAAYGRPALFAAPPALRTADPVTLVDGGPYRLSTVLGGSFSLGDSITLRGEWAHRGGGYDTRQWRSYLANVGLHRSALAIGDGRALPSLAFDLSALGQSGSRRDYAFVGASYTGAVLSLSLFSLVGLADASTTSTVSLSWKVTSRIDLALQATLLAGSKTSEFGLSPFSKIVSIRLIRRFR